MFITTATPKDKTMYAGAVNFRKYAIKKDGEVVGYEWARSHIEARRKYSEGSIYPLNELSATPIAAA